MIHLFYLMYLLNSLGNTGGGYLSEALHNSSLLVICVSICNYTVHKNCCISNRHYPVVHTAAATPKGKKKGQQYITMTKSQMQTSSSAMPPLYHTLK